MAQTATALAAFPHWRNLTGDCRRSAQRTQPGCARPPARAALAPSHPPNFLHPRPVAVPAATGLILISRDSAYHKPTTESEMNLSRLVGVLRRDRRMGVMGDLLLRGRFR